MSLFSLPGLPGSRPADLGPRDGRLKDCPSSPNCVCSDSQRDSHRVAAFEFVGAGAGAFASAKEMVAALPRTRIVEESENYLHAECRTALLGFVDDLELHLRDDAIAVRSASRLGYSDLGLNRRRVEELRTALRSAGILR